MTNPEGKFSFPLLSVAVNMQFRVQMPERPGIVSPIVTFGVKPYVKTKVNKHKVKRGKRVRFSGTVNPGGTGGQIAIQKQRDDSWVTVGGTIIRSGGRYSKNLKIRRGGTYRVWAGWSSSQYAPNVGKKIKIRSFR